MPRKKKQPPSKHTARASDNDVSSPYCGWVATVLVPALVKLYLESKSLPPKGNRA